MRATTAVLPLMALANAAVLDLVGRTNNNCGVYGCLLSYFGSTPTAYASASAFCTSYLSISTSTVISVLTTTPALQTITQTTTSTSSVSDTLSTTSVTTVTTTPTTSVTATSICTPSQVNNNQYKKRGGSPTSCAGYVCSTPKPQGYTCGSLGLLFSPSLLARTSDRTFNACRDSCIGNSQCNSFSFFNPWGPCQLFTKQISSMNLQGSQYCVGSPLVHWDKACFSCASTTSVPAATSTSVYSIPSQYSTIISSACSCLGVTTPVTTSIKTSTASGPLTTAVSVAITTVHVTVATNVNTVTTTATAPASTTTVATITLPNTQNGTYTNSYGDTYAKFPFTDFNGGDLMSGTCYNGGQGFNVDGTWVPCNGFYGCIGVCSYVNRHGYNCSGVTYTPNPSGYDPVMYSTCYLKSDVPGNGCGDVGERDEKDSAILLSRGP